MKRLICVSLVLMLALSLCACGGEEAPKAEPTVAATEAPAVPAETPSMFRMKTVPPSPVPWFRSARIPACPV